MAVDTLRLKEGITLPELQEMIAEYVDLKGCPGCGLNGFDLRFEVDEGWKFDRMVERFDKLSAVTIGQLSGRELTLGAQRQLG